MPRGENWELFLSYPHFSTFRISYPQIIGIYPQVGQIDRDYPHATGTVFFLGYRQAGDAGLAGDWSGYDPRSTLCVECELQGAPRRQSRKVPARHWSGVELFA